LFGSHVFGHASHFNVPPSGRRLPFGLHDD
jgi:hypothetical protein